MQQEMYVPCLNRAWSLPAAFVTLHVGDLHSAGWAEGPWALRTPVKAVWVGMGVYK